MASTLQCLIYFSFMMLSTSIKGIDATSMIGQVPEGCQQKSFCEDAPDYPNEYIKNLMANVGQSLTFSNVSLDDDLELVERLGGTGTDQELNACSYTSTCIQPKQVKDKEGHWHWVINDQDHQQWFKISECHKKNRNCKPVVIPKDGHKGCCEQKYSNHEIAIVYKGKIEFASIELPSFCKCVVINEKDVCPIN